MRPGARLAYGRGLTEPLRGGASDLYGSGALSGVIHLVRKRADQTRVDVDASYGSQSTPDGSVAASLRRGSWGLRLHGTSFSTDGYVLVAPAERGPVDTAASSRHDGVELAVERGPDGPSRQFAAISAFRESRGNGTPLQTNDTRLRQVVLGADWTSTATLSLRAYAGDELYHRTFSTITADRSSERPNRQQRVPAQVFGAWGQWAKPVGGRQVVVAGADVRRVEATSEEVVITNVAGPLVASTPALITRQRKNVALIRARGVEADAEARLGAAFTAAASWLFVDSVVVSADQPALAGLKVAQVPRHQGSLSVRYAHPAVRVAAQARFAGRQFDDDLNLFPLGRATTVDLLAARPLGRDMELYAAVENVFDARYDVGRTPVRTLGPPRSIRAGLRIHAPGRP